MAWASDAQRRWGHTAAGLKALGGAGNVAEWDSASKGMNLPQRVGTGMSKIAPSRTEARLSRPFGAVRKPFGSFAP